jgi:UDP-sulfoquinovose synthase
MKIMVLGADGYVGWAVSLFLASSGDNQVVMVDNYQKRRWMANEDVIELHPVPFLSERVQRYTEITGKANLKEFLFSVDLFTSVQSALLLFRPDVIINCAQQPSAPYSMISPAHALETLHNNEATCLNVLWAAAQICPDTLIITIGSAGCYLNTDTDFIPRRKVDLRFGPHTILNSWLPMQASDIYHQSKVNTFGLTDMFTKMWDLRTITVQQSTIFGQCIAPHLDHPDLYSRFSYDHIFGTVLNRFICQSVLGQPLTVYGTGSSETGIICLCDCVKRIAALCELDVANGQHIVEHNVSQKISIQDMAERVVELNGGTIRYIESPRIEEPNSQDKVFEDPFIRVSKTGFLDDDIMRTVDFVKKYAYNIKSEQLNPTITWSPVLL